MHNHPYMALKNTRSATPEGLKGLYPCLFRMDTQDKWSNKIFIRSILPMSFFNGHTGQMDKQYTYSKHFTQVFL